MAKVIQVRTIEMLYKEKLKKKINHKRRTVSGFMHVHLLHDNAPEHQSELVKS